MAMRHVGANGIKGWEFGKLEIVEVIVGFCVGWREILFDVIIIIDRMYGCLVG